MPVPSSNAHLSSLVSELASLPHTFDKLHSSTRNATLVALRQSVRSYRLTAPVRTIILRTVSHLLGPNSPPENSSWTALPLWNEETLRSLLALLVDALDEDGFDEQEKKLTQLPVTEHRRRGHLSSFGQLMLTPGEKAALEAEDSEEEEEEEEESLLPCASSIFPDPPVLSFSLQSAIGASQPAQLAAAHVSHALAAIGRYDRAPAVRRAAFLALTALTRAMPPDLLAAFLPGLASSLARGLQHTTLDQAPVLVAALDAFVSVIFNVFPDEGKNGPAPNARATSFAEALQQRRIQTSQEEKESDTTAKEQEDGQKPMTEMPSNGLLVVQSASWTAAASKEISLRLRLFLESKTGPSSHESVRVRLAVVRFVRVALLDTSSLALDHRTRNLLIYALIEFIGDEYPVIQNEAMRACKKLTKDNRVGIREIEACMKGFLKCIDLLDGSIKIGKKMVDSNQVLAVRESQVSNIAEDTIARLLEIKHEEYRVQLCKGFLRLLLPSNDAQLRRTFSILTPQEFAVFLIRVGVNNFCKMLLSTHHILWRNAGNAEDEQLSNLKNIVLESSFHIGNVGLLSSIYSTLFIHVSDYGEEGEGLQDSNGETHKFNSLRTFKSRAHAVLVLQAAVRGAIMISDIPKDKMKVHVQQVLDSTKDVLDALTSFFLPAVEVHAAEGADLVDDTMVSLKHCLLHSMCELIRDMSVLFERELSKPLPSEVVLTILISVLKDVSHGEKDIRKTAHTVLSRISTTVKCSNARTLLARHLNYLISRIGRRLENRWAIDVLSFIIGTEGDDVGEEAILLLESTFRNLNNSLAGAGNSRALRSLGAVESVLATAVRQSSTGASEDEPGMLQDTERPYRNIASSDVWRDLLQEKLLFYCTENIPNDHKLLAEHQEETEMNDNEEDEENYTKKAFETIALNALDGMRDLLVGRPWNVRAAALGCATWAVYLLKDNQRELLPHAANILPLIPDQFAVLQGQISKRERLLQRISQKKIRAGQDEGVDELVRYLNGKGTELPVVIKACSLLSALAQCAGHFIRSRFVKLIYPRMRPLLRLSSCFPTLLAPATMDSDGNLTSSPSFGAMSASDACLEALSSMAEVLPISLAPHALSIVKYLAVYFNPHHDPNISDQRNIRHLNRSMIKHERERWEKRAHCAESIVLGLKKVNPGDVLTGLLCSDESTPTIVKCGRPSLQSIQVHNGRSVVP